jgi:hypothetical protein
MPIVVDSSYVKNDSRSLWWLTLAVDIATKLKIYITHIFFSDQQPRNLDQLFWAEALPGEFKIILQRACARCVNDHEAQSRILRNLYEVLWSLHSF